jgi:hypothetical protein
MLREMNGSLVTMIQQSQCGSSSFCASLSAANQSAHASVGSILSEQKMAIDSNVEELVGSLNADTQRMLSNAKV